MNPPNRTLKGPECIYTPVFMVVSHKPAAVCAKLWSSQAPIQVSRFFGHFIAGSNIIERALHSKDNKGQ